MAFLSFSGNTHDSIVIPHDRDKSQLVELLNDGEELFAVCWYIVKLYAYLTHICKWITGKQNHCHFNGTNLFVLLSKNCSPFKPLPHWIALCSFNINLERIVGYFNKGDKRVYRVGQKNWPRLRDSPPGPEAEPRNLGQTFFPTLFTIGEKTLR